jgi:outer membrane protein OmpA-like peptidoglycan-associated protein/formylmethanofuran dehydrogenase subunit D
VSGNYYEGGKGYYGNIGVNYSFGAGKKKEMYEIKKDEGISEEPAQKDILKELEVKWKEEDEDKRSAKETVSDKEIVNIWKVKGERDGTAEISKEAAQKMGMEEGAKVYVMKYDDKVLFFVNEKEAKQFKTKAEAEGKKAEIKETELKNGKVSFKEYEKELGDMREGMLAVQYEGGANEIKSIPEEAKRAQRDAMIEKVLGNSNASMVWELKAENEVIKLDRKVLAQLGIKEGSKVYLLSYGSRVFLFEDKSNTQDFVRRLQEVGANIDEGDIREIEGRDDNIELKAEDINKVGDLSKGVRLEYYDKEKATEIKSIAQEQKKTKEAEITQEKLEGAKERREKEMMKKYKLNVATFKVNDYKLSTKAKEAIAQQAKEIRKSDYNKITIEGHTDTSGSKEVNERLSRQRAESVYNEFLLNGIPSDKISYIGYGEQMQIAPNTTKEERAANRRTEIYVE